LDVSITLIVLDASSPRISAYNYLICLETIIDLHFALIVWDCLHSIFSGSKTFFYIRKSDVSAVQGHPRSLILVPIKRVYATSYQSVTVTLALSRTVSEILQVFVLLNPPLFHPTLGVFPLDQIAHVGVNVSRYLKLIDQMTRKRCKIM